MTSNYTPTPGDLVRVTGTIGGVHGSTLFDIGEVDGEFTLWHEVKQENYGLAEVLSSDELTVELVTPFADRLPTEPGGYVNVPDGILEIAEAIGINITDLLGDVADQTWTLNEDGTWTDADGESRGVEDNYILATNGLTFVKVD